MRNDLDLNLLGNQNVKYDFGYNPDILETFDNKHPGNVKKLTNSLVSYYTMRGKWGSLYISPQSLKINKLFYYNLSFDKSIIK